MKASKFSEVQIAFVLKQAERMERQSVRCAARRAFRMQRFTSMDCSPFASFTLKRFDAGRLQTSIRRHHFRSAQMGYPHTYASTNGRPCRPL